MKCCARQFNLYLPLLAISVLLALSCGCQSGKKDKDVTAALRIHIEASDSLPGTGQTVSVLRADPVVVSIAADPILTEANVIGAAVISVQGGYAVEVKLDQTGAWTLEQFSAANPGKHFVIYGQWGDKGTDGRWLAAPLISHRIDDGLFSFTPDASRAETDRLVLGLNNVAKKNLKALLK
jgi:preprotein translocase subunit SecD